MTLGWAGWSLFRKLKLPAAVILGPMVAVSLGRIAGLPFPLLPPYLEYLFQVVLGFLIGANITRKYLNELRKLVIPAAVIAVWSGFMIGAMIGTALAANSSFSVLTRPFPLAPVLLYPSWVVAILLLQYALLSMRYLDGRTVYQA